MRKGIIVLILILFLLCGCGMTTKYEYYSTGDDATYTIEQTIPYKHRAFQTYTPALTHTITSVKVKLYAGAGLTGNIYAKFYETSGGYATTLLGTSSALDATTVTTNAAGDWYTLTVSGIGASIVKQYALEITQPMNDGTHLYWFYDSTSPAYSDGKAWGYIDTWADLGGDFMFEIWGDPDFETIAVCAADVRLARPLLIAGGGFDVPICAIDCVGLQPYIPLGFIIPICAITCTPLQGLHTHLLNHPIIKPEYFDEPRLVNRVYVVGIDADGNTVYGEAKDTTINGEVLQIYPDSMIPTKADAGTIATNRLAKDRLNAERGQILIPPALQMEQWDVIKIDDTYCNQGNTTYRVAGWQFVYQPFISKFQDAKYEQLVKLTAV